jgi:hypothetical protein
MYVYVTGIAVACLGLSLLYSTCLSYLLFVLLTIGLVLLSVAVVVWVHIKLSSRHVATVGAETHPEGYRKFQDITDGESSCPQHNKCQLFVV